MTARPVAQYLVRFESSERAEASGEDRNDTAYPDLSDKTPDEIPRFQFKRHATKALLSVLRR